MLLACQLVVDNPLSTDLNCFPVITLVGFEELEPAVAVPLVVPIYELDHPKSDFLSPGEWAPQVVVLVPGSPEQ